MVNSSKTWEKSGTLLLVLLAISFLAAPAQAQYGGGAGEPNDPYLIYDANQMNAIGADSNDWDKHFILMANIDLSGFTGTSFNNIGYFLTWQDNNPFTGVFDGNCHTISNFTYDSNGVNGIGLFGYVDGPDAEIKNLGLIDPNVNAGTGGGVGSLVGRNSGTITNCYAEGGSVLGGGSRYGAVGGLVGNNGEWGGTGTITNCYSNCKVSGENTVGGLVGSNGVWYGEWGSSLGVISNCYSAGNVSGDEDVGGLVGYNSVGTITDCYSKGNVSGGSSVGGLVGKNGWYVDWGPPPSTISNCYSTGSVAGDRSVGGLVGSHDYGTINNCYATGSVAGNNNVGGLVGWNTGRVYASFWDIETSGQTTSAVGTGKTTAEMQMASTFIAWWGCDPLWTIDEGKDYPRLAWEEMPGELITAPSYGGGSGDPNDPYLIYTAEQLNTIGLIPCDLDKNFKLMADIDLSSFTGTAFNIIGTDWENPFTGVFDGSGHTISNFTYTSTDRDNIGLFGYVDGPHAEIKNLGLIDADVNAATGRGVGSLVGRVSSGNITNCYVQGGNVSGNNAVGGLVGHNSGTINNCFAEGGSVSGSSLWYGGVGGLVGGNIGTITNCYSTGDVSGNYAVGGLVGTNGQVVCEEWDCSTVRGTISNCYSTASVSGTMVVGGLVGVNPGTINNCYTSADVSGNSNVGGLVGVNGVYECVPIPSCWWRPGSISNCYSTGSITGTTSVGGLVGYDEKEGVTSSFWDTQTSGQTNSAGGTGKTTAEMQTANTFINAGWDFNTPVWTIDEGADYPRLWWEISPVLHAEPEVTLGTSNTISWDPVPGANDYYAECAEDANFTSILYSTGWITETSYEFTGLELDQRYWYSVKARNSAGTETGWSNVESALQGTLADAVEAMLDPDTLKNKNMKNALLNKINAAQQMIDDGLYADALNKLQNDILQKTDGCAETGQPDKNDWIITCEEQEQIYPLVIETIEHVKGLMD